MRDKMVDWLSRQDEVTFDRVLRLCQRHVSESFSQSPTKHSIAEHAVLSLDLLCTLYFYYVTCIDEADQSFWLRESEESTRHELFCNATISSRLDIRYAYQRWLTCQPHDLHYLDHPHLLDVDCKTQVWRFAVLSNMASGNATAQAFSHSIATLTRPAALLSAFITHYPTLQHVSHLSDGYFSLDLRRQHLTQDFFDQVGMQLCNTRKPLKTRYVHGGEEGLDQGGLQKEFFLEAAPLLFDVDYGMFFYNERTRLRWINGQSTAPLHHFEILGAFVGLAVYNGIVLDLGFPLLMWKRLLGCTPTLVDLTEIDPEMGRGLRALLDWETDDVEMVFARNFEISFQDETNTHVTHTPLIPGGQDVAVTNDNRVEFVQLYVDYVTTILPGKPFDAFKRGFYSACDSRALQLFTAQELSVMAGGTSELDMHALESVCEYEDGYSADHPTIRNFWSIVHTFIDDQKRLLLKFITASDRAPPGGLSKLRFSILRNGPDSDRLPTSYTCFNRLLLPEYTSHATLRTSLLIAMEHGVGFGLV
jgi:ubiquitin-protein ligase E3 A